MLNSLLAAALIAVALPAAAEAAAGDDATVVVITKGISTGHSDGQAVGCPAGQRAIGGGVGAVGRVPSDVVASGPLNNTGLTINTDDNDVPVFWFSAAYNGSGADLTIPFYAICSANSDATLQATTLGAGAASIGTFPYVEAAVPCPGGQRAIGGGVGTTGSVTEAYIPAGMNLSGPLDENGTTTATGTGDVARYWDGGARNFSASPRTFKVYAVCSAASQATVQAIDQTFLTSNSLTVACPSGQRAIGGGASSSATTQMSLQLSAPDDASGLGSLISGNVPRSWTTSAEAYSGFTYAYKWFAMCEPDPPAATAAPTGQQAIALKKCKKKKKSARARKRCRKRAKRLPL